MPNISLPLGENVKNCQRQWTTGLRSPRGIAAVAYAKNMPPACFLNAAGWHGEAVTDEGNATEKLQTNSEERSKMNPNYLIGNYLRIHLLNFDTLPLIRRCAPPRSVKKTCRWHVFSVGHSGYAARRPQSGSPLLLTILHLLPQGKA